ncbi:MAG: glutathione S-transferase family protein [Rhodobacteraceae bacterium]|nr:glutathione S-transferase family protein [Paracoccaceae bacterium]
MAHSPPAIHLHHVPFSRSFRILWLLAEMGLSCQLHRYSITDGSLRSPAFLKISPAGRVPALEIDGHAIFESEAIVQYLCETRPQAGLGRCAGDSERLPFLQWLGFAETQASILGSLNLQHLFLRPPVRPSPQVLKIETARLAKTLQALDAHLKQQDWLLESGFSAADTMMGFNLFAAPYYVSLEGVPHVAAYTKRIAARPAYQQARAQDGVQAFYRKSFYDLPKE